MLTGCWLLVYLTFFSHTQLIQVLQGSWSLSTSHMSGKDESLAKIVEGEVLITYLRVSVFVYHIADYAYQTNTYNFFFFVHFRGCCTNPCIDRTMWKFFHFQQQVSLDNTFNSVFVQSS